MAEERAKRKLTAILSADVKGYSRLMGEDELSTIETLKKYRELINTLIQQYRGRVVDSPGDNMLIEFSSVVDAVDCAVEIQKELKLKNDELPENRRMEFRIGVNLGDVVEDSERIYGDGVNIAARVESLAEGGGICVSGTAYDQIGKKLDLGYEYLGEQVVKNIEKPVRVYRVLMEPEEAGKVIGEERPKPKHWRWAAIGGVVVLIIVAGILVVWNHYIRPPFEPASVERMAFPLPEKPSIAVLPFDNLSGDPGQEYLADGITENIITALSKIPEMFVIARNSSFTYKGKPVKVQQVSEDLGVQYVLEGSIQKADNRVRVTGQLVNATTGHHLWAEQYERELEDLFAVQDEITMHIVAALQVELTDGEQARVRHRSTNNLQAWGYAVRGYSFWERFTQADNAKARELFEQAVESDPEYAWAWTMLGLAYFIDTRYGWHRPRDDSFKKMVECAQKSVKLDESDPDVHVLLGNIHLWQKEHDKAIVEGEKSISLGPNNAENHAILGMYYRFVGRFEDSVRVTEKAIRLHPYYPDWYLFNLEYSYYYLRQYEKAIATAKKHLKLVESRGAGGTFWQHLILAQNYIRLGREDEARYHAAEGLRLNPKYTFEWERKGSMYKDPALIEQQIDDLRKAGLSDKPSLPLPDKPSIAVLPFTNMSDDSKQEYFSDGITEEIITALSKTSQLFVIARNSSFTYKEKPVKVQQVGRELGVKYVLEGSVRKAGNKVRVTAQLIDAKTGHHLWAERYDRDLKDVFAIQDDITKQVIAALHVKLTIGEDALQIARGTDSLEAYLKYLQAREHHMRMTKEENIISRRLIEEAISIDPEYGIAYSLLAVTHMLDVWLQATKSPKQSMGKAVELARKAITLGDAGHDVLGFLYLNTGQHEKAISQCQQAVEIEPNSATAHSFYGLALTSMGRFEEAVHELEQGVRLDPTSSFSLRSLANAYSFAGRHEEAIATCKKAVQKAPNDLISHIILTRAYSMAGRIEEAQTAAAEILRINPNFSLESYAKRVNFKNQADSDRVVEALRNAGLK